MLMRAKLSNGDEDLSAFESRLLDDGGLQRAQSRPTLPQDAAAKEKPRPTLPQDAAAKEKPRTTLRRDAADMEKAHGTARSLKVTPASKGGGKEGSKKKNGGDVKHAEA